jgi:hypothetical protein
MPDFVPGERYPVTTEMAAAVMRHGWPAVVGQVDITRGRRFVKAPCTWQFWTTNGHRVDFDHGPSGLIISQTREPDPELPPPL